MLLEMNSTSRSCERSKSIKPICNYIWPSLMDTRKTLSSGITGKGQRQSNCRELCLDDNDLPDA